MRKADKAGNAREARMRRKADLQGLVLTRSRRRDPHAPDYGKYWLRTKRGMLVTDSAGISLDAVEEFLTRTTATGGE